MATFQELYETLLKASVQRGQASADSVKGLDYDPQHLDCLLHPEKHPVIWQLADCDCPPDAPCMASCEFDAISRKEGVPRVAIDVTRCVGCAACAESCHSGKLTASKDILPALEAVRNAKGLAYALIAPAFQGQFSPDVTPGMLRSAFLKLGFDGMLEVALFADILTLKEAFEFDQNIHKEEDFQLTSCCCPLWIAMLRKSYSQLMPHVPGAVSPMIACGRAVKALHPDAVTVFVGPCLAKKSEAREPDLKGAVDYVLTFEEMRDVFDAAGIDPSEMEDKERDHSSRAGRIYAHTGGVSEAVRSTVERLNPHRKITVKTQQADGVRNCKEMLAALTAGNTHANFYEGMGCVGGCVGGPKAIIDKEQGRDNVVAYGEQALYPTPMDNPYVIELLHRLGIDTVETLLNDSDIFIRKL